MKHFFSKPFNSGALFRALNCSVLLRLNMMIKVLRFTNSKIMFLKIEVRSCIVVLLRKEHEHTARARTVALTHVHRVKTCAIMVLLLGDDGRTMSQTPELPILRCEFQRDTNISSNTELSAICSRAKCVELRLYM